MSNVILDRLVLLDISRWHWALTIPLLAAHLAGVSGMALSAIILCGAVAAYFLVRLRRLRTYPVQIRLAYLGLLLVGMLPWMGWIHWIQLAGTTAMVNLGYFPFARTLSLAPFNREVPVAPSLLWHTFLLEPWGTALFSG